MTNREVCMYISTLNPHKNDNNEDYIADRCVIEGYGQTTGGYLDDLEHIDFKQAEPSQKKHFLDYYSQEIRINKAPSYNRLFCPQLMLFIAEVAGVSRSALVEALEIVKEYENRHKLRYGEKNAVYLFVDRDTFNAFKEKIHIFKVNQAIRNSKDWNEVCEKVRTLFVNDN